MTSTQSREPTRFAEVNDVLRDLVCSSREILGDNFCGAYLQGSFAIGDADEFSDVDWIIVTHHEVGDADVSKLQTMHKRLYRLESEWAQHLEGSYFPRELLRAFDPSRRKLWFLDNGATELIEDDHCNTAVARWITRERGITMAGPHPKTLIEPVPEKALRDEAVRVAELYKDWAPEPTKAGLMSRWKQPYLVLTYCRLLNTIETGEVKSKLKAGKWAIEHLDPKWASLIERALADRPDPWARVHQAADPAIVERTLRFVDYGLREVRARARAKDDEQ